MTDRDRLIELIQEAEDDYMVYEMGAQALTIGIFKSREEYIADHLIANGVICPPCKVGDTVYALYNGKVLKANIFSMKIETEDDKYVYMLKLKIFDHFFQFKTFLLGKTVFLTCEEAEKALERSVNND